MQTRQTDALARTVSDYLGEDHDRLDALYSAALGAFRRGELELGEEPFGQFRSGLELHIRIEEDVLFPEFERLTGMHDGGPTLVMRMEHERIGELLEAISDSLSKRVNPLALAEELLGVLGTHNGKEESVLYPMTDNLAGATAAAELVQRMHAY